VVFKPKPTTGGKGFILQPSRNLLRFQADRRASLPLIGDGPCGSWVLVPVPQRGLVLSNGAAFTNGSSRVSNALTINAVNLLHDPLGPLNRRSNQRFCSWTRLRIEEVFRRLQMAGHQYSCHDREHSFASFVHARQLSIFAFSSLFDSVDFDQNTRTGYRVHSRPGCRSASKYAPGRTFPRSTSARRTTTWFWSCTVPVAFKSWVPVSLSRATS